MISTQRVIIMLIMMNLLYGVGIGINNYDQNGSALAWTGLQNIVNTKTGSLDSTIGDMGTQENREDMVYEDNMVTVYSKEGQMSEGSIWAVGRAMKATLNIILGALNPFSVNPIGLTGIEWVISAVLFMFRSIMNLILIIELILVWRNKKST